MNIIKYKYIKITVIALTFIVFLSGCWDASDINKKDITTTTAVDRKDDQYVFLGEIANLVGKKSEAPRFTIIKSYGKTYSDAREALDIKHPKPVYLGSADVLIFTIPLVEYGIEEYLYRVRNVHEYRKTLKVVTTKDDVEELLRMQQESDISSATLIDSMLTSLTKQGKAINVSASEVIEWLNSDNDCFALPNIDMNENKNGLELSGYTVVHNSVYRGFISSEDTKGLILLLNNDASLVIVVPFKNHEATVKATLKKKKIEVKYQESKIIFDIDLKFESVVKYLSDDILFSTEDNAQVNSNLEKILYNEVQYTIDQAQSLFKCDYLEFSNIFRVKYPKIYKKMRWQDEFPNAEININIKNELDPGGEFDYNAEIFWKKDNE